jgi:glycosylphosphatidylinositol transamidase (GPIT) subunit GPI8
MSGNKKMVEVDLLYFIGQAVKLAVKECMPTVIEEHQKNCPINDVKNDLYGNGNQGIKTDVGDLKKDVKRIKECKSEVKGFFEKITAPVIAALIVAFIFFMLNLYSQSKFEKAIGEMQKTENNKVRNDKFTP